MNDWLSGTVHAIWSSILDVADVTTDDNFFELGGISIKGSHMRAEIRHEVGAPVRQRGMAETPAPEQFIGAMARPGLARRDQSRAGNPVGRPVSGIAPSQVIQGIHGNEGGAGLGALRSALALVSSLMTLALP
ncbi:MAG: hypothetical protein JO345_38305 [Streptosporangiaceae bacterium]|nr:hypothetical protein [Streptosporangiaceae bacterium]